MNWDNVAVFGSRNIFHKFCLQKREGFFVKNQVSNLHSAKVAQTANAKFALSALLLIEQTFVPSFDITVR